MFTPRPYQDDGLLKLQQAFLKGFRRILLLLGTGGGKSVIVRLIFERALKKNPNAKLLYIVHRSILINQMKKTLHGLNVEIHTLQKIGKEETKVYDLVLSDETHFGHGSKLMKNINYKFWIGLTATGIDNDGYPLDGYDKIIDVAQLKDLIDWGFMPPLKVMSISKVDTSKLKVSGRDFNIKQSFQMMDKSNVKRDIVDVYKNHAMGLKTIIYCINTEHCESLKKEFDEANIKTMTVHSKNGKKKNTEALEYFENSKDGILINCDVLTTGLDFPDIYCLIMASPTKSFIKAIQIYGRLRLNPKDKNKVGLILDCAEVIKNTQHPYSRIDLSKKRGDSKKTKKCGHCNEEMYILSKKAIPNDQLTYIMKITHRCKGCGNWEQVEELKAVNYNFCEGCGKPLEPTGFKIKETKKAIQFYIKCMHCNHQNISREVLFSDAELKEITINERLNSTEHTWEKIYEVLKLECKKWNYNWRWTVRCIEVLKNKNKTPDEVIGIIEDMQKNNVKIGKLMYV